MQQYEMGKSVISDVDNPAAWARLYDTVSVAFSYPNQDFYMALSEGGFAAELKQAIGALHDASTLVFSGNALAKGAADTVEISTPVDLESDYVGLFELNRRDPPLHLNAHLYADDRQGLIPLMQRLQETYQSFGVQLKLDEGTEQPDHLTVQLEFMAYLFRGLDQALRGEGKWSTEKLRDGIRSFRRELMWVTTLVSALEQRSNHPFYVPLGRFLLALVRAVPA